MNDQEKMQKAIYTVIRYLTDNNSTEMEVGATLDTGIRVTLKIEIIGLEDLEGNK